MKGKRVDGVVCLWEWAPKKADRHRPWVLREAYPVDDNGYRIPGGTGRVSWEAWAYDLDADGYPAASRPGRAVTGWWWCCGPIMLHVAPPRPTPAWLDVSDLNSNGRNSWPQYIAGVAHMEVTTGREAERVVRECLAAEGA